MDCKECSIWREVSSRRFRSFPVQTQRGLGPSTDQLGNESPSGRHTRVSERNRYREELINYQQNRRAFYEFEDAIKQDLRLILRSLEQSKVLFELNRRSIKTAVEQVELARFRLVEPVQPGAGGGQQRALGATSARDLTDALNQLQSAQSNFLSEFVTYEALRRGLDLDLGTMQLGPDGQWLDPGVINVDYAFRAAERIGIPPESICLPAEPGVVEGFPPLDLEMAPAEAPVPGEIPLEFPDNLTDESQ